MGKVVEDGIGVLDRMTLILEAFDQNDRGLGISELALRAGLPKSTVSRLVATLVKQRYLERDGKLIHLGLRLFELGQLAEEPRELRIAALPVLAELRDKTGENVHLAIRDGGAMVCIATLRGRAGGRPTIRTGSRLPVHATSLGKAVLAHSAPLDVEEILSSELRAWTSGTVTDPVRLRGELADVRRRDAASEVREYDPESSSAAAAVFAPSGRVAGAISVSCGADRFDLDRLTPAVRAAASAVARRLATTGPAWG
ncbi:IclR family transcriptional regulator [Microbacterium sp. 4R-513]|uniref:IclR family transcriptional regulator n=1 Tax=Microbacterium sp. 4R-513 TaxID=2567934 RepID=UPI0019D0BE54|nr:IclR family transcriptional regulator [Microbacterium sp. 4R-513]